MIGEIIKRLFETVLKKTNQKSERLPIPAVYRAIGISMIVLVSLLLIVTGIIAYNALSYNKVYKGVYINNIYVGNKSVDDLNQIFNEDLSKHLSNSKITLKVQNYEEEIKFKDLNISYDVPSAVKSAYNVGRNSNIITRIKDIFKANTTGINVKTPFTYNKKIVFDTVDKLYDKTVKDVKGPELIIQEDKVSVRSGHAGRSIDKYITKNEIIEFIDSARSGLINIQSVEIPSKMDLDYFYNNMNVQPQDATIRTDGRNFEYVNHVAGRSIDKTELTNILNGLQGKEDTLVDIPVKFSQPKITLENLKAMIFKDNLQTQSSTFFMRNPIEVNRAGNIKKAVETMDGTIIAAGETFSFNNVVGQRTEERGYRSAYVFIKGKMVEDTGGGICQVASTLHRAVLYSDLEIVQRQSHQFMISYVDNGTDAAVFWDGNVDYKFKNNTSFPVKVLGQISGMQVVFTFLGTKENPDKTIEIETVTTKEYPSTTTYEDDPTMEIGTEKQDTRHAPAPGADITTYKIVKEKGTVISKKQIYTSHYNPYPKIILRGTKPKAGAPATSVVVTTNP